MRIVFLLTTSLESPYGLGRCWPFAHQLAQWGYDVHIVALHHDFTPNVTRHFQRDGVTVAYVGQMHVRKVGDQTIYFGPLRLLWVILTGFLGLLRAALQLRADIYHIGKPHLQNSLTGLMVRLLYRRSTLLLDYDDLEVVTNRTSNRLQQWVLAQSENHVPRWVDGVTVHSHFLYERLRWLGIPASAMLRLPSSVDPIRFQQVTKNLSADDDLWIQLLPAEALAEWRTKIAAGQPRIILYVGTLTLSHHPVDLLLQAFAQLARDREDCRLLLVGGGADLLTLQAMAQTLGIAERCCFVGRVPPAVAPYFFHVADLSVDPVHDDLAAQARWPLKIVESLAAGLPVVTGAIGDRAEMLGNGAAGRLVQPGSAAALATAMGEILDDPVLHKAMKVACLTQARQFESGRLTAQLVDFYTSVR